MVGYVVPTLDTVLAFIMIPYSYGAYGGFPFPFTPFPLHIGHQDIRQD